MSDQSDQGEKVHDPTPQKLEEARAKGDIPRSMDVSAAAAMIGLFIALSLTGSSAAFDSSAVLAALLDRAHQYTDLVLSEGGAEVALSWFNAAMIPLLPIFVLPFGLALASLVAQRAFAVSLDKLTPKLSRLSMLSNAKQKFGPTGLVQFLKSTIKMLTIATVLVVYLLSRDDELIGSVNGDAVSVFAMMGEALITITLASSVIYGAIALIDLLWQRYDHMRRLRMSHQDLKDEQKKIEGDPHAKQQRRQRGKELATNRMLLEVPTADVVIVNPTHFAVALAWDRTPGSAPVCVAKGVDEVAMRIREIAAESGVPIQSDPPTARAVHASVDIGEEIEPEHYRAVAAAINFAEKVRQRAKGKGGYGEG